MPQLIKIRDMTTLDETLGVIENATSTAQESLRIKRLSFCKIYIESLSPFVFGKGTWMKLGVA